MVHGFVLKYVCTMCTHPQLLTFTFSFYVLDTQSIRYTLLQHLSLGHENMLICLEYGLPCLLGQVFNMVMVLKITNTDILVE